MKVINMWDIDGVLVEAMHLVNTEQQNAEIIKSAKIRDDVIQHLFLKFYQPHDRFYTGRKEYLLGEATLELFRKIFQDESKAQKAYENTWFYPKESSYNDYIPIKFNKINEDIKKINNTIDGIKIFNVFDDDERFITHFNENNMLSGIYTNLVLKYNVFRVVKALSL